MQTQHEARTRVRPREPARPDLHDAHTEITLRRLREAILIARHGVRRDRAALVADLAFSETAR